MGPSGGPPGAGSPERGRTKTLPPPPPRRGTCAHTYPGGPRRRLDGPRGRNSGTCTRRTPPNLHRNAVGGVSGRPTSQGKGVRGQAQTWRACRRARGPSGQSFEVGAEGKGGEGGGASGLHFLAPLARWFQNGGGGGGGARKGRLRPCPGMRMEASQSGLVQCSGLQL